MIFARATALRASSIARLARPAFRATERQPWQQMIQRGTRRTYASAHGAHDATKTSDVPWMICGAGITVGGLYAVLTQELGHGAGHDDEHHDEKHHNEKHEEAEEAPADEPKDEPIEESKAELKHDDAKDQKEDKSPDESDKAGTQKEAKSTNETSGKQEGLSNADTNHSTQIADNPEKSSKGEGVAETAKLKGTVSTDRPQK